MKVKFFFEQMVDGGVEIKGKAGRSADAKTTVKIKTTGAIQKEIDF